MALRGSRVGIIGGSIAGCATAIALERLGCAAGLMAAMAKHAEDMTKAGVLL